MENCLTILFSSYFRIRNQSVESELFKLLQLFHQKLKFFRVLFIGYKLCVYGLSLL